MNEPYLGQTTDMVLGQEFLTWLWFRSETQPMGFKDKEGVPFSCLLYTSMGASLAEQASFKACTETPRSLISLTGASSSESSSESGE